MNLESVIGEDQMTSTSIPMRNTAEKPPKKPRSELLAEGMLILTQKLDILTNFKLRSGSLLGGFQVTKHPHMIEHLSEKEKEYFKEKIDITWLPVKWIIELWEKIPGTDTYRVTEYTKLK